MSDIVFMRTWYPVRSWRLHTGGGGGKGNCGQSRERLLLDAGETAHALQPNLFAAVEQEEGEWFAPRCHYGVRMS
jgi:hypothetical protein